MNSRLRDIAGRTAESACVQVLYEQQAAALWLHAPPLTGDPTRAQQVA